MGSMDLGRLRNLGIVAHIDAGKTTVTERILHLCGVEHRIGRVDEGTATMDWMAEERERGITITSAATRVTWRGVDLNLIDTPGHVDFTVEVERCMRVLDGGVLVIDAVAGVQAQSETVWRQMRRHGVPCIAFVNKCDKPGADVLAAVQSLRTRLGAPAHPLAYPLFEERELVGMVDLLERAAWTFAEDGKALACPLPERLVDEVEVLRSELVDTLADEDEGLLEAVLEGREPTVELLRASLRRRVVGGTLVPVWCGAALRGIGIEPLLDAIVAYLPSPLEVPAPRLFDVEGGEPPPPRPIADDASLLALAFKVQATAHGDLTFVRLYSGTLKPGQKAWNPRSRVMERPSRILRVHADHGAALESAGAGDIVALVGLKDTGTGDTLCDRAEPVLLEPPHFPEPVMTLVAEPASADDRPRLRDALAALGREDPTLRIVEDEGSGQWTISGMGELHLEVLTHRLAQEFHVEPRTGPPRVSFREALREPVRRAKRIERSLAGRDVVGAVTLKAAPADEGVSVRWDPAIDLPAGARAAVEEALRAEASSGPRFGFPLVGLTVAVVAAERHRERESDAAYAMAAAEALREALAEGGTRVLEPRMALEVQTPEEFAGGILADLLARHAEVGDVRSEGDLRTITGTAPLARMFGYSTAVRSLSQGRAGYSLSPAGFVEVPESELESRGLSWA